MAENKKVRFWRGTSEAYERIKKAGMLNYWVRYSVKYVDRNGLVVWREYYGDNPLTPESGQLLPVIDIVDTLPDILNPGDRYLVSNDDEHFIVEIVVENTENGLGSHIITFNEGMSVRVKTEGYKSYTLYEGKLVTYDEVDCGTY